jgi:hypothetical protein
MDLELWIEDSRGSQGMRGRKCKITDNKTGNEGNHKEAGNRTGDVLKKKLTVQERRIS